MPWTRLWRTGVLHSCASGIGGNYDDAFAQFWQQQFNRLPDSATIVDVGTGNGAIPLLAQSIADAEKRHWQIHGVDLADIDPPGSTAKAQHRYGNIRFHANTSMTELPFADGSADLVCSQFAFEYAPRERAASEILRVIGTHGHAALIAHSEDSVIHQVSSSQAAACTWLLQESRIFTAARQLLHHLAQAGDASARHRLASDPRAESARADFNASAVELMDRIEQTPEAQVLLTLAQELGPLLQHDWNSVEAADAALTALHDWARDEQARLQLMLAASLDAQALQHVVALFSATGLAVRTGKLMYRGTTTMGWTMVVGHD